VGLKLPEIPLGLWHNLGGTAPLERSHGRRFMAYNEVPGSDRR
jgi:hypothetical protein